MQYMCLEKKEMSMCNKKILFNLLNRKEKMYEL